MNNEKFGIGFILGVGIGAIVGAAIGIEKLIEKTNGYSGADIESVVVESIENAFTSDKDKLSTGEIIDVINETKCISDIMGEKLEKIKKFYETNHFKSAT